MNIKYDEVDKLLTCQITEEIDHHTTEKMRRMLDDEIERYIPKKIIFDFDKVSFMDSAGIGMILGRYKMVRMLGGSVEMINVNPSVKKIFEMSGIPKIIPINKNVA
jgi:stage II sporulation protein AA (anti-sigma F factor antagonist)